MRGRARLAATLELLAARRREKSAAGQAAQAWPAWSRLWAPRPADNRTSRNGGHVNAGNSSNSFLRSKPGFN